jgi:hypothetical protein
MKSGLKLLGLFLLIALFSGFMLLAVSGPINAATTQNTEKNLPISGYEEWYSPFIELKTDCWCGYTTPPNITVKIWDDASLDDAYYQVDAYTPSGNATENWTVIFENSPEKLYEGTFQIAPAIFNHLTEGLHKVYFKAWDDDHNVTEASQDYYWAFYKDLTPPDYIEFKSPKENATVSGTFKIIVKASDNVGIAVVKFWAGPPGEGEYIGEIWEPNEDGDYVKTLNANEGEEGTYQLYARAYDFAENYLEAGPINITVKHSPEGVDKTLVIVLVSVGAVAIAATTAYVVRYRRRASAYERTVSKLGETKQLKQPLPSKMKGAISAESEISTYVLPGDSRNISEISDKLSTLPLSDVQKEALSFELQAIPAEERAPIFNAITGSISANDAQSQLNALMKELEMLEQKEQWSEVLIKLDKGIELAEFLGDQALFNSLVTKIDEIRAIKGP